MTSDLFSFLNTRNSWISVSILGVAFAYGAVNCLVYFSGISYSGDFRLSAWDAALIIFPMQILPLSAIFLSALFVNRDKSLREKLFLKNWRKGFILQVFVIETVLLPLIGLTMALTIFIMNIFKIECSTPEVMRILSHSHVDVFLTVGAGAVITAPFAEELFFRNVLFGFISSYAGKTASIIITSAAFAGLHFSVVTFLPLFILGVILQILFIYTGSIYPCIILHGFHNFITIVILYFLKCQF